MDKKAFKQLHNGDQVFWKDPDNGECSGYYTVLSTDIENETAKLINDAGSYVEVYRTELK